MQNDQKQGKGKRPFDVTLWNKAEKFKRIKKKRNVREILERKERLFIVQNSREFQRQK